MKYVKAELQELVGKTLTRVSVAKSSERNSDTVSFFCKDGTIYRLYHPLDWGEIVTVEDVCGELEDLIGSPILMAEAVSNHNNPKPGDVGDYFAWTFYKFATIKGYVTIRWYGSTDGAYRYSIEVDFVRVEA